MHIIKIDGWDETPSELFEELVTKYVTGDTASYDVFLENGDVWTWYLVPRQGDSPLGPVFNNEALEGILWLRGHLQNCLDSECLEEVAAAIANV